MTRNNKITAIVLAKNEESMIKKCLKALSFCDEVLVIDDYSLDKTPDIARSCGARVYRHHLKNNFAQQRNFGLSKAQNPWVLFIDADEIVSVQLKKEILQQVLREDVQGFYITRRDYFLNHQMRSSEFGSQKLLRLARVDVKTTLWTRSVHEVWPVEGKTDVLMSHLFHYSHSSMDQVITQISFHAQLHGAERGREIGEISVLRVVFYPVGKFLQNFILRSGYRDSTYGFVAIVFMSFHSFLSWSSIWINQQSKK